MRGDCDVSMLISKDLLVLSDDKQTQTQTQTQAEAEAETCVGVGELNDITTQNDLSEEESIEVNVEGEGEGGAITTQNDIDWNHEFPPLVTPNTIKVLDPSPSTWVDALKKPCCPKNKFHISTKVNGQKSNVNGEQYCDSDTQLKAKSIAPSVFSTDEHELASSFFSINIPNFHDKFLKEQISLADLRVSLIHH